MSNKAETYRPPNWPYDLRVSFETVVERARAAKAKSARKQPLNAEDHRALSAMVMLRDCYITDEWVWRLACKITGKRPGEWHCDPFCNEWSYSRRFIDPEKGLFLDGHDGRDGLAVERDGRPSLWLGDSLVNGPHSCTEDWIQQAAIHGKENCVAAVVQVSGQKWLLKYGMQCDVAVELGRMNYVSPPGLPPAKGNPLGSSLLIWDPKRRLPGAEPFPATFYKIKDRLGKVHTVLARPGRGGMTTRTIEVD